MAISETLILDNVYKSYPSPDGGSIGILSGVSMVLRSGEILSIQGRSGSGKSTLLHAAALLLPIDSGRIEILGNDASSITERKRNELRQSGIGFVFQSSLLLADFTALENTAMPLLIQGIPRKEAYLKAEEMLVSLSLGDRMSHRPDRLSGGERQRTAIARALVASPKIVFADEPTGSLDERSAESIEEMLLMAAREKGASLIYVTHNSQFAAKADRALLLSEGRLSDV